MNIIFVGKQTIQTVRIPKLHKYANRFNEKTKTTSLNKLKFRTSSWYIQITLMTARKKKWRSLYVGLAFDALNSSQYIRYYNIIGYIKCRKKL